MAILRYSQIVGKSASRIFAILFICAGLMGADGGSSVSEYKLKAAFIFNFAKFVTWPDDSFESRDSTFRIGVLGTDPFGKVLDDTVAGKSVGNRSVQIKRGDTLSDLADCHILFISRSKAKETGDIIKELEKAGVLTVGDMNRFAESGGVIGFYLEERKIRLAINTKAAKSNDLKISSKLLSISKIVKK